MQLNYMTLKDSDYLTNIYILYAPITQCSSNDGHGPRSIGQIDPVDPADPRNGTRRSGGSDWIVWPAPKRRSKSIQHDGRLSNVLTTCFYTNNGHCIELCCQNDAICCEYDVILQKPNSLIWFTFLFLKYWYSGLSAVRMCSLYFIAETDWFFILCSMIGS